MSTVGSENASIVEVADGKAGTSKMTTAQGIGPAAQVVDGAGSNSRAELLPCDARSLGVRSAERSTTEGAGEHVRRTKYFNSKGHAAECGVGGP